MTDQAAVADSQRNAATGCAARRLLLAFAGGVLATSAGCLTLPEPTEELTRDLVATPERYRAAYGPDREPQYRAWLSSFDDERLANLVEEALLRNYDLYQAAAVREQVFAAVRLAQSNLLPRVDGLAVLERDQDTRRSEEVLTIGGQISWEADLWGRLRAERRAARHDASATALEFAHLRQSLAALVAEAWFAAIAARMQLEIDLERVHSEESTARAAATRAEAGAGMPLDYDFAQANLAFAQEELATTEAAYAEIVRSLELLLGRYPNAAMEPPGQLPAIPDMPGVGVPAELLERRPDLVAAEQRVAAAFYREHAAQLTRLPRVRLTGFGGVEFDPARGVWTLAADLLAPLFTGGEIEAQIAIASAQQKAAMAAYVETALQAFYEVERALSNQLYLERRRAELDTAVTRLASANVTAQARYEAGVLTIFDLNQIRQNYFRAKSQQLAVHLEHLRQRIRLHLALGGAFDDPDDQGPPVRAGRMPSSPEPDEAERDDPNDEPDADALEVIDE